MKTIDINCDVGEGIANEAQLMPYISSCNIACTGHAGTIESIDKTIRLAKLYNLKIGAHPSFPDKQNFGRKLIQIPSEVLQESLEYQINIFKHRLNLQESELNHIKAHGVLYNVSAKDEKIANTIIKAIKNSVENVTLYVPFNSVIAQLAIDNNIDIKYEAFIDRNYNDDLSLVDRNNRHAVIIDKEKAFEHLIKMVVDQKVRTINNIEVPVLAETFCVHSDNLYAKEILVYISKKLNELEIKIN